MTADIGIILGRGTRGVILNRRPRVRPRDRLAGTAGMDLAVGPHNAVGIIGRRSCATGGSGHLRSDQSARGKAMAYFVTGATGFIGQFLVANLLKRGEPIYVLVRKSSAEEALRTACGLGRRRETADRRDRRSRPQEPGRDRRRREKAQGQGPAFLSSRRYLRRQCHGRGAAGRECRGHRACDRARRGCPGGLLPSRQLDRRGRPLRRRLPRGHVRGGRGPRSSVLQDQARFGGTRAAGLQAPVPHLPSGHRRRPLEDRLHRQDRRAVLFLQVPATTARSRSAVDAADRDRRRAHQHHSGRLRRRCARPSRAQARASTASAST